MSTLSPASLPVAKVAQLRPTPPEEAWLIRSFWASQAVGIIGGSPKCCKSWLGLDMALSVASGTPCLDRFPVQDQGPALIYLAEDALPAVRARVDAICRHRNLQIEILPLYAITCEVLRLDLADHQQRLQATLANLRPRLLLLDPLVRLHRLDENSAAEISKLLGFLRELQRTFELAVVLVHHASKKHRAQPGQALRGSSDLHAFGDSNAYLARRGERLVLTLEHRAAKPPDPFELDLVTADDGAIHLAVSSPLPRDTTRPLTQRVLDHLRLQDQPQTRTLIRAALRVQNERLGLALTSLQQQGLIHRTPQGWTLAAFSQQAALSLGVSS